jgi:signal transduction histidine kinase
MQPKPPQRAHIRTRILDLLARSGDAPDRLAALNIFFDLSLEFESLRDFKSLCVLVPDMCLDTPASLYMRGPRGDLRLRRTTSPQGQKVFTLPDPPCPRSPGILRSPGAAVVTICGDGEEADLIGALCLHREVPRGEDAFWLAYSRGVARMMAVKQTAVSNRKRLTFITSLVRDIGHNVIVPNIQFKLLFLHMERQLARLQRRIGELAPPRHDAPDRESRLDLPILARDLASLQKTISKRFQESSLFLESLLRRSHFEKGAYDLHLRPCRFKSQVFEPQIERFLPMFRAQDIRIEIAPEVRIDEDILLQADVGLFAQVFANLLANAIKYTRAMPLEDAREGKLMRYGWETAADAFGPGREGVRLFVATTGLEIPPGEQALLFDEGFRSAGTDAVDGSGHGLSFVKQIVELHRGRVGYAYEAPMNVFSITMPRAQDAREAETCPTAS